MTKGPTVAIGRVRARYVIMSAGVYVHMRDLATSVELLAEDAPELTDGSRDALRGLADSLRMRAGELGF